MQVVVAVETERHRRDQVVIHEVHDAVHIVRAHLAEAVHDVKAAGVGQFAVYVLDELEELLIAVTEGDHRLNEELIAFVDDLPAEGKHIVPVFLVEGQPDAVYALPVAGQKGVNVELAVIHHGKISHAGLFLFKEMLRDYLLARILRPPLLRALFVVKVAELYAFYAGSLQRGEDLIHI